MKELLSLLNDKERRGVGILGIFLAAVLAVFVFLSVQEKGTAARAVDALAAARLNAQNAARARNEKKAEGLRWREARQDWDSTILSYFYSRALGIQDLRLDIQKIFDRAGVGVSEIGYGYLDLAQGRIGKVTVDFRFSGNYAMFKRLLDIIEKHPRFLYVEKIDFLYIGRMPGLLELKITLAGYYES